MAAELVSQSMAALDPESIVAIVFMSLATGFGLIAMIITNARKMVEARHKSNTNPEEVNALRHEVAHLREMMSDVLLQLEYQRGSQPEERLAERITPPEFKQRN